MDLKQMLYTLTIAQLGTMTRAAESLHISQSALSLSLKNLEEELGVSLFQKEGRNIYPTEAGLAFCKKASDILLLTDELKADMTQMRDAEKLTIRICTDAIDFSNEATNYYCRNHAEYNVEQLRLNIEESKHALLSHRANLALSLSDLSGPNIASEVILEEPMYALISQWQKISTSASISLGQLSGLPIVTQRYGFGLNSLIHDFFQQADIRPGRTIEVNDPETIVIQLSKVGGVSFIPESAYRSQHEFFPNASEEVRAIPVKETYCKRRVYLSYLNGEEQSLLNQDFAAFLREMGQYVAEHHSYPLNNNQDS